MPGSTVLSDSNTCSESCALVRPCLTGRRMSTSRDVPKFCTAASEKPSPPSSLRMRDRSAACGVAISMTVPPVNSTEKCSPRVARKNTAAMNVTIDTTLNHSAWRMNGMSRRMRKNSMAVRPDQAAASRCAQSVLPIERWLMRFCRP